MSHTDYPEAYDPGPWDNPADDALEAELAFNREVSDELRRLRVRKAAQERLRLEDRPSAPPFDLDTLRDVLARPAGPPDRVAGLIPSDAGTLVVAQRKTGKTTLNLNLTRCLITGETFLGRFDVEPVSGRVAILNYEVSAAQLARWADEAGVPHDRLILANLRGRRNPLGDREDRERLAESLRSLEVESVIVDPFGRAYTGTSQNDSGEVGSWLVQLDEFTRSEVGARDLILTAHAGWNGERTRGSSALEDWADSIVTLTRDPDDETARFLRATGRDVEVDEDALTFDPATRTLSLAGTGSRKHAKQSAKTAELAVLVVRAVTSKGGEVVGRAVLEKLVKEMDDNPGFRNGEIARAADYAAAQGHLCVEDLGAGKPKIFRSVEVAA